jgi:5-methylcytosine-specific restriction endonuclease McrA
MNRWNIPALLEQEVIERDSRCIYCGTEFTAETARRRDRSSSSWEHIINDARIISRDNIARCCVGCNASKGTKTLIKWLESKYCSARGITRKSIASVARSGLQWRKRRDA